MTKRLYQLLNWLRFPAYIVAVWRLLRPAKKSTPNEKK